MAKKDNVVLGLHKQTGAWIALAEWDDSDDVGYDAVEWCEHAADALNEPRATVNLPNGGVISGGGFDGFRAD